MTKQTENTTTEKAKTAAKAEAPATVTVQLTPEVVAALDKIKSEMSKAFPGINPSRAELARIAIVRSVEAGA